jgi:hypothetical protein
MMRTGTVLMAIGVLLAGAAAPVAAQEFRFNPPDGTTYVETLRITRENHLGWLGDQTESLETTARVRITRTSEGYTAAATLLSVRITEDGRELESPLLVLPIGKTFTYDIDAIGRIRAIRGMDELMAELSAAVPDEEEDDSYVNLMADTGVVAGETEDWHSRIGSLVGRSFQIGSLWSTAEQLALPMNRKLAYTTTTRVIGKEKQNGRECVRLRFTSTSSPRAPRATGKRAKTVAARRRPVRASSTTPGVSILETGERVVDPRTMLIYAESSTRTLKMKIDVLGEENVPTTMIEKRQYRYQYE